MCSKVNDHKKHTKWYFTAPSNGAGMLEGALDPGQHLDPRIGSTTVQWEAWTHHLTFLVLNFPSEMGEPS